ncbi:ubiquitinyl hydrolase 1 [Ranunculus cassubicifolius]
MASRTPCRNSQDTGMHTCLSIYVKVSRNEDLAKQIGRDSCFDLVDHTKVRSFHLQKQMPFKQFKEEVAKLFAVPIQFQRYWLWAKRQNHTYRPNRPLTPQEEGLSVGQVHEILNTRANPDLNLFLEVELGPDLRPVQLCERTTEEDILIFCKLFDPIKEELRYVGKLFVKARGTPSEILTKLNAMAGFSPNEEISLYEEIKFEPVVLCEPIDIQLTFRQSQIEDGDIVCVQKSTLPQQCRFPDVPSFLDYVQNRQVQYVKQSDSNCRHLRTCQVGVIM